MPPFPASHTLMAFAFIRFNSFSRHLNRRIRNLFSFSPCDFQLCKTEKPSTVRERTRICCKLQKMQSYLHSHLPPRRPTGGRKATRPLANGEEPQTLVPRCHDKLGFIDTGWLQLVKYQNTILYTDANM